MRAINIKLLFRMSWRFYSFPGKAYFFRVILKNQKLRESNEIQTKNHYFANEYITI